jgi:hypothetical protein
VPDVTNIGSGTTTAGRERLAVDDYVRRLVDAAPPLTAEQRDRLAVILRGDAAGSDGADAGKPRLRAG